MTTPQSPHHIDLAVSGSELPLLKLLLDRITLTDNIEQIHIEIWSDDPLVSSTDDVFQDTTEPTEATERTDPETDPEPESKPATDDHPTDHLVAEDEPKNDELPVEGLDITVKRDGSNEIHEAGK